MQHFVLCVSNYRQRSVINETHLWLRVDIRGSSDARPATISAHEDQNYAWAFNGMFVVSLHPDLFNGHREILPDYLKTILDPAVYSSLDLFAYAISRKSTGICDNHVVPVTGILKHRSHVKASQASSSGVNIFGYFRVHLGLGTISHQKRRPLHISRQRIYREKYKGQSRHYESRIADSRRYQRQHR
jgi:hypothetical protein